MRVRLVGDAGAYGWGAPSNVDQIHGKRNLQSSQTAFRHRCGYYEYHTNRSIEEQVGLKRQRFNGL